MVPLHQTRAARAPDKKSFTWHLFLNHLSKFKIISQNCSSWYPLPKLHKRFCSSEQKGHQSSRYEISLKDISSWTTGPNSKWFHRIVPHNALYQNYTNGSAPLNKGTARALDKKCPSTTSSEPLVQIQNNFTELFLIKPFTKIAQMVPLCWTKGLPERQIRNILKQHLLNHWPKFIIISHNNSIYPRDAFHHIAQMVRLHWTKGLPEL